MMNKSIEVKALEKIAGRIMKEMEREYRYIVDEVTKIDSREDFSIAMKADSLAKLISRREEDLAGMVIRYSQIKYLISEMDCAVIDEIEEKHPGITLEEINAVLRKREEV